jgi:hypothetical protein
MWGSRNFLSTPPVILDVRVSQNIDRSSWLVLAGVAILTVLGLGATFEAWATWPAADTVTPTGVVATYVRAIQTGDAFHAWLYLAQDASQTTPGEPPRPVLSEADFRAQVQNSRQQTSPRVRILNVSQSADTATVQLEVSHASGDPLTGVSTQQLTVTLTRLAEGWRITSDPYPWQFK